MSNHLRESLPYPKLETLEKSIAAMEAEILKVASLPSRFKMVTESQQEMESRLESLKAIARWLRHS